MRFNKNDWVKKKEEKISLRKINLQEDDNLNYIEKRQNKKGKIKKDFEKKINNCEKFDGKNEKSEKILKNEEDILNIIKIKNKKRMINEENFFEGVEDYLLKFNLSEIEKGNEQIKKEDLNKIENLLDTIKAYDFLISCEKIKETERKLNRLKFLYYDYVDYLKYLKEQEGENIKYLKDIEKEKSSRNIVKKNQSTSLLVDKSTSGLVHQSTSGQAIKSRMSISPPVDKSTSGQVHQNQKKEENESIFYLESKLNKSLKKEQEDRLRLYFPKRVSDFIKEESIKNNQNCMQLLKNFIEKTNFANFKFVVLNREELSLLGKNEIFSIRMGDYLSNFSSLLSINGVKESDRSKFVFSIVYPFFLKKENK